MVAEGVRRRGRKTIGDEWVKGLISKRPSAGSFMWMCTSGQSLGGDSNMHLPSVDEEK